MNQQYNNDLRKLDEVWKSGALDNFIRRMLVYFDPMNLTVLGAPNDEYDADIPKIKQIVLKEGVSISELSDFIFNLYKGDGGDVSEVKKKAQRMAEDLFDLKNN